MRSRAWVCSVSLFAFMGLQALPGAMFLTEVQAQERQQKQLANQQRAKYEFKASFMDAARARQQQEALVSQKKRIRASESTGCKAGDCNVTSKALDLSKVPTEKQLQMAGGFGGALSPVGPANEEFWKNQYDKELKGLGVAGGLASRAGTDSVEGLLVATKRNRLQRLRDINLDFGKAMQEWNKHKYGDAAKMLREHIEEYPESPWGGEAALHLGCDAKYNGRFTESAQIFRELLDQTDGTTGSKSFDIHQKAKLRWADLNISTGKLDDARDQLNNIIKTDKDWRRRTWAFYWLRMTALYKKQARTLRACGSKALGSMLADLGRTDEGRKVAALQPTRENGFSLAELQTLASKHKLNLVGFDGKAQDLEGVAMPAILHYDFDKQVAGNNPLPLKFASIQGSGIKEKSQVESTEIIQRDGVPFRLSNRAGHFLVAQKVDAKTQFVSLYDPQERRHYKLSYAQLNREWSGKGLMQAIAKKPAPVKAKLNIAELSASIKTRVAYLSKKEMKEVVGGCCGVARPPDDDGPNNGGPKKPDCGSPSWSISPISLNMYLSDTPLWYKSPVGPSVAITMNYNSEDSISQNTVFGNKWMFNYASYVVEDTAAGGGQITVFMPNSRKENFVPDGNGGYVNRIGNFMELRKVGATGFELIDQSGEVYVYDVPPGTNSLQAYLLQIRDPWSKTLTFGYDSNVHLTTITDALGKVTKLSYDVLGHIVKAEDPFGRFASFSYDEWGNMVEVVDLEGNAFQYTYDSDIYITRLNTAQGAYDFKWELPNREFTVMEPFDLTQQMYLTITDPANRRVKYGYFGDPATADRTTFTNPAGKTTTYFISLLADGRGRVTKTLYSNGEVENSTLDNNSGAIGSSTDNTGASSKFAYNQQGQITAVTNARGFTTRFLYAANGIDMVGTVDATGKRTGWATFNSQHRITSFTDSNPNSSENTVSFTYTSWGAVKTLADPNGSVTTYTYDEGVGSPTYGELLQVKKDATVLATYTYDNQGRKLTATGSDAKTVSYEYNDMGNVTQATLPDGSISKTEIACCGIPTAKVARNGKKTYYDYDLLKRMTRIQDAMGNSVEFDYDVLGNLRAIKDSKNSVTSWAYDDLGRVVAKRFPDGSIESYSYDVANRRVSRTDAQGRITTTTYDVSGNTVRIDRPGTTNTITLAYDALNRPSRMRDGLGVTTFAYDFANRVAGINEDWSGSNLTYSYDALGKRIGMSVGGGSGNATYSSDYGYDALDRLQTVTGTTTSGSNMGTWTFGYIGDTDQLHSVLNPNGTSSNYSYDGLNRLTGIENKFSGGANLSQYAYGYETGAYALTSVRTYSQSQIETATAEQVNYDYDDVGQLLSEASTQTPTPSLRGTYSFDAMGNRATQVSGSGTNAVNTSYTRNTLNQVTGQTAIPQNGNPSTLTSLLYDVHGNLTQSRSTTSSTPTGTTRYDYNEDDRLVGVTSYLSGGVPNRQTQYAYDGLGRKRKTREYNWDTALNSGTGGWAFVYERRYIMDGMDVVQERDHTNLVKVAYTRAGNIGGLLGRTRRDSGVDSRFCYHYDGAGNVVQLTDYSGSVAAKYSYDAWGNLRTSSGSEAGINLYRFATKEKQAYADLYDFGYRFYSPGMGRFLNRDPISENGGLNLYAYASNSPTLKTDAYGLSVMSFMEGFAVGMKVSLIVVGLMGLAAIAFPAIGAFLTTYGAALGAAGVAMAYDEYFKIMNSDLCPDERDYRLGLLCGGIIGGFAGGGLLNKLGPKIAPHIPKFGPKSPTRPILPEKPIQSDNCFVAGTKTLLKDGTSKIIEEVKLGERVVSRHEKSTVLNVDRVSKLREQSETTKQRFNSLGKSTINETRSIDDEDIDPQTWRRLELVMSNKDGSLTEISLLRPTWWIQKVGAVEGKTINLSLPEMDMDGPTNVLSIRQFEGSKIQENGTVIGTFKHISNDILDLQLLSEGAPIGVTSKHPFHSVDREVWISASELKVGERITTGNGSTKVVSMSQRDVSGIVYNLEVHRTHTYFVGSNDGGVWVHNVCPKDILKKLQDPGEFSPTASNEEEALQWAREAFPDALELPKAFGDPYPQAPQGNKDHFQVHPPEPNVGNMKPHVKYEIWSSGKKGKGGSWGHIWFD